MFFYRFSNKNKKKWKTPLQVRLHYHRKNKRTSLFFSFFYKKDKTKDKEADGDIWNQGSMTVEAAVVFPILLCALMGILLWAKVLVVNQSMEMALLETGRQLARKEYLYTKKGREGSSIAMARALFKKNQKQGDGGKGISVSEPQFLGTEYKEKSKEIRLKVRYRIHIPMMLLGTWKIQMGGSIHQKAWNGYAPAEGENTVGESDYVYVTVNGTVYHKDGQCYHLHVTIKETQQTTPYYEGKTGYRPCEHCIRQKSERANTLYIPEEGDCFHTDPGCSGLIRTVQYVKKDEVGTMVPCSHCSQ